MRISDWSSDVCSSDLTASGVLELLAQGVYRMAGTPPQDHESVYATWLALVGATSQPTETGAPALAAAGVTAAVVHEIGDFFLDGIDFIVGSRKTTRLSDVRLRIRPLTPADTISVNGLPTLTVERTITDLLDRKSTRLNSSHSCAPRMPSTA